MTNRQAAVLTSRIFCVWFIYNAVSNLAILPNFITSLQQGSTYSSVLTSFQRSMLMNLLATLFRLGVDVAAAIFFYRCGPALIGFLTGDESDPDSNEAKAAL